MNWLFTNRKIPPHAGQHTRAVLAEIAGYDAAAIDHLIAAGVALETPVRDAAQEF